MKIKREKFPAIILVIIAFIIGFFLRGLTFPYFKTNMLPTNDTLPTYYGCGQIARWHADYLMREFGVDFSTDKSNSKKNINQKAGELNGKLLEICTTDPTK